MPVNTELLTALLAPIPGENPAGADLRYDARIAAIKDARREDPYHEDPSQRKFADWQSVISGLTPLLTKETKDLQFAAWLTEAMVRKQGYAGLATGLALLHGFVQQFWDTVHPAPDPEEDEDLEVRAGPLEWVGSNLAIPLRMAAFGNAPFSFLDHQLSRSIPSETDIEGDSSKRVIRNEALELGRMPPETVDAAIEGMNKGTVRAVLAELQAVRENITALEQVADEKFGRDAPSLLTLRGAVDEIQRFGNMILAQKLETDPDPIEIAEESETVAASDPSAPMAPEPANRADAAGRIAVVAKWYRKDDPTNPAPYAMVRGFRWGELRTTAPELDPRLLEAPPTAMRSRLKGLMLDGKWSDLLELGESLMATPQGRGWLDLQRYALTACAQLGAGYDPVAAVIRGELRSLLAALPKLPEMTLMDDTPTANGETTEWLDAEGLRPPADADATPDTDVMAGEDVEVQDGSDVTMDALDDDHRTAENGGLTKVRPHRARVIGRDTFESARSELAQGRPNRAIELLVAELQRERSPRGHFVRQTQIAYIMVEAGLDAVAQPILQKLIETVDEKFLEQWEAGPLVAQPMALMCRVIDRTGGDSNQRYELYLRVCRLDPLQALALQAR